MPMLAGGLSGAGINPPPPLKPKVFRPLSPFSGAFAGGGEYQTKPKNTMKTINIKPLKPSKAAEHPGYSAAILHAAAHFLSRVPQNIDGRGLLALLSYGSKAEMKSEGVLLWDAVPDARDAASRIDALARHMLAVEGFNAAHAEPPPVECPLEAALRKVGLEFPPDVLETIRRMSGIKAGDKVEVTGTPSSGLN